MTTRSILLGTSLCLALAFGACTTTPETAAPRKPTSLELDRLTRNRCLAVLREGLRSEEFWPAIHAAEGLALGGHGDEVIAHLEPKLATETDDQKLCGISRELVRAGDISKARVMLGILARDNPYGHIHAAESLYKANQIGDGVLMKRRFDNAGENFKLKLMAAAALGRQGDDAAMAYLRESMASENETAVYIAAWVLGRIGNRQDVPLLQSRRGYSQDEVRNCFIDHSLASLGDPGGLAALKQNLSSTNPAIRTYAATFAGDARAVSVAEKLKAMLDDPHADARYRAAQSLLHLSR
ncbi:MAG: hypothetical protein CMO80_24910 [Verrucomicrobiales bacterium]|nr:hypothetical protein [Verrucomicrobiales bacterium]